MSNQANGMNGELIGSKDYFKKINKDNFINAIMEKKEPSDYYGALCSLCERIVDTFEEVYSDLQRHEQVVKFIPDSDRANLTSILLGMYDICRLMKWSAGKCEACISILKLDTYGTRMNSNATQREFDEAYKLVIDGGRFDLSRGDRMDAIRKATEDSIEYVGRNDSRTLEFLNQVAKGQGREFFGDIWLKLLFKDNPKNFTGKCGRVICSKEYIDHIEKHIFETDIPNYYMRSNGDRAYEKLITDSLKEIIDIIQRDLEQSIKDNEYLLDAQADNLKSVIKQFEKCGLSCGSMEKNASQLMWNETLSKSKLYIYGTDYERAEILRELEEATGAKVFINKYGCVQMVKDPNRKIYPQSYDILESIIDSGLTFSISYGYDYDAPPEYRDKSHMRHSDYETATCGIGSGGYVFIKREEQAKKTPVYMIIMHELIHASHAAEGKMDFTLKECREDISSTGWITVEELKTIGLEGHDEGITENSVRGQYGWEERVSHDFLP